MHPKSKFARFLEHYSADVDAARSTEFDCATIYELLGYRLTDYTEFLTEVARSSFAGGLIRFLLPQTDPSIFSWNSPEGWVSDWKQWDGRLVVFAYDWLGRQISFDLARREDDEPLISILEPGTGQLLEVPENFHGFIEQEIIDYHDAALASTFHSQWIKNGNPLPLFRECVGYKVPLFLGGEDSINNVEISDIDVYVSLCGQYYSKADS